MLLVDDGLIPAGVPVARHMLADPCWETYHRGDPDFGFLPATGASDRERKDASTARQRLGATSATAILPAARGGEVDEHAGMARPGPAPAIRLGRVPAAPAYRRARR